MKANKQTIIDNLRGFIAQRSGMDHRNYGDRASYNQDRAKITRHGKHARELLRHVELSGITAEELVNASQGMRLEIQDNGAISYTTGQYFPVEYRASACSLLSCVLWDYWRQDFAKCAKDNEAPGSAIRRKFREIFGRTIANAWFN